MAHNNQFNMLHGIFCSSSFIYCFGIQFIFLLVCFAAFLSFFLLCFVTVIPFSLDSCVKLHTGKAKWFALLILFTCEIYEHRIKYTRHFFFCRIFFVHLNIFAIIPLQLSWICVYAVVVVAAAFFLLSEHSLLMATSEFYVTRRHSVMIWKSSILNVDYLLVVYSCLAKINLKKNINTTNFYALQHQKKGIFFLYQTKCHDCNESVWNSRIFFLSLA